MTQYSVYLSLDGAGYLLDVQSDLLDGLNLRVVVPLLPENRAPMAAKRLNPVFEIAGATHVMMTQYIASVPASLLSQPIASLDAHRDAVTAALDMLFHGY